MRVGFFVFTLIILLSCKSEICGVKDVNFAQKSIVLYLVADNNLHNYAESLVNDVLSDNICTRENRCFIFIDDKNTPILYILSDTIEIIKCPEYEESLSEETINNVLKFISINYPAQESGLVLWSHGTGWINTLPANLHKSFGADKKKQLNIPNLFQSLPIHYDYIIFDACYMGGIEILYEAKDKCEYLLAAPQEVPSKGILDSNCLKELFYNNNLEDRLRFICDKYVEKYESFDKDVSISLCNTSHVKNLTEYLHNIDTLKLTIERISEIPAYEFAGNVPFFDAKDSFIKLELDSKYIDHVITYNANRKKNSFNSCGLSIFIPTNENVAYYQSYTYLSWEKDIEWLQKFVLP